MNMYQRVKKDTKWSIVKLGHFSPSELKKEVESFSDEWLLDISRQNHGLVHRSTEMFRLCATDYNWIPNTPVETVQHNSFKNKGSNDDLNFIFKTLEEYYSGKIIRCEVIKLYANSQIYKHVDGGPILNYSRRVHIPLITNKEVTFTVMDNTIHMEEFGWYEINNQMPHSANNPSSQDRVHMIIDIMPDDMLNYTKIGE
jgi:hypothetical protein